MHLWDLILLYAVTSLICWSCRKFMNMEREEDVTPMAEVYTVIKSSNIKAMTYDDGDLTVTFHSGYKYRYSGVGKTTWQEFKNAESKGKFFNANIKGKYEETKLP